MKKMIRLAALLLALLVCQVLSALAEDPIRVSSVADPQSVMGEQEVRITLKIYNSGAEDITEAIKLYDSNAESVEVYEGLKANQSVTYTGTWRVTAEQIEKGVIPYYIKYTADGAEQKRRIPVTVQAQTPAPQLTVSCNVSPASARTGQTVTLSYILSNTGNVPLNNIAVSNPLSQEQLIAPSLAVGEKLTLEDSFVMGDMDLVSAPVVTYQAEHDTNTYTLSDLGTRNIAVTQDGLEVSVSGTNTAGVYAGETIELTVDLKNTGATVCSNVSVTLDDGSEVVSGVELKPGASWSGTVSRLITGSTAVTATAVGADESGAQLTVRSPELEITAADADKALILSVHAQARETVIHEEPAVIRFGVVVQNLGQTDAIDLTITEAGTPVAHIDSLPSGQTKTVVFDLQTSIAGSFQFVVTGKDASGNDRSYSSDILKVAYVAPTPVPTPVPTPTPVPPTPTPAPTPTPTPTLAETISRYVDLTTLYIAAGVLAGLLVLLLLIGGIASGRRRKRLASAIDEIGRTPNTRNYNGRKKGKKKPAAKRPAQPAAKPAVKPEPPKAEPAKETKPAAPRPAAAKPAAPKAEPAKRPVRGQDIVPTTELTEEVVRKEREQAKAELEALRRRTPVQEVSAGNTLRVMPVDQRPEFVSQGKVDNSATRRFDRKATEEAVRTAEAGKKPVPTDTVEVPVKLATPAEGNDQTVSQETRLMPPVKAEKPAPKASEKKAERVKPMKKRKPLFGRKDRDLYEDDEEEEYIGDDDVFE